MMQPYRMTPVSPEEIGLILEALGLAASRRESQARAVKHGRHHDIKAQAMRQLRHRLFAEKVAADLERIGGKIHRGRR